MQRAGDGDDLFYRTGIGVNGAQQTIFFTRVTEAMRSSNGGGNPHEGELIDTIEIPVSKAKEFIFENSHVMPPGCAFAILWFLSERRRVGFIERMRENSREIFVASAGLSLGAALLGFILSRSVT